MKFLKKYWNFLRRMRVLHVFNNILHYSALKKNKALYKKYKLQKNIFESIAHKDFPQKETPSPWLDNENSALDLKKSPQLSTFNQATQQQLLLWPEKGYAILNRFVDPDLVDKVNNDLDLMVLNGTLAFDYTNTRVMNLIDKSEAAKKIATNSQLTTLLSFILGKKVVPFQSINFIHGSQQKTHSDSIHMTTHPMGYLIAIWVALEDLQPDCGLVHYYPGSHKLPYVMSEDFKNNNTRFLVGDNFYENYEKKIGEIISSQNLQKEIFLAKKGDVLIWHANLLHGGEPRTNPLLTRKSLVIHYFCEGDVINYHEITQRPAVLKN